ncbi:hypothetical protein ACLOJK_027528, partial [Asimina triloba]
MLISGNPLLSVARSEDGNGFGEEDTLLPTLFEIKRQCRSVYLVAVDDFRMLIDRNLSPLVAESEDGNRKEDIVIDF